MEIIKYIYEIKEKIKQLKNQNKTIGFVPTMGFLHKGHLSLIERAKKENDIVILSIFVNPTQFGENEDFEFYPKDLEHDLEVSQKAGADFIFLPTTEEMYPHGFKSVVKVNGITNFLCGASRPGHFDGVATVVTKLFHILTPDKAYFGQKDAQQVAVIKQMVKDLNFDIDIISCPIVREKDGLAMSSRNVYLSEKERKASLVLSKSLIDAKEMISNGEKDPLLFKRRIVGQIEKEPLVSIDYVEIINASTFEPVMEISQNTLICLAVKIGKTRLIDNMLWEG